MAWIELRHKAFGVTIDDDLVLAVAGPDGRRLWQSSRSDAPTLVGGRAREPEEALLSEATEKEVLPFADGRYRGGRLRLRGYETLDVCLELGVGLDESTGELLIEIAQVGGSDVVHAVRHLYCFEKSTADGGYMVLPHGSGYLIGADCADELPGGDASGAGGIIGARWTLPMFGMVRGEQSLCVIADTWWDCDVSARHVPDDHSSLDFSWDPSLGSLGYPRRQLLRFDAGMDYAGMAKLYRERARREGLVRTLAEKAGSTPIIRRYVDNVLLRWPAWNPDDGPAVLADIGKLNDMGFGVNFFYPKWAPGGYTSEEGTANTASAIWQAFLHPTPVPGGWPTLVKLEHDVHDLGCTVQGFVNSLAQAADGPQYDSERRPTDADGHRVEGVVSTYDAPDRMKRVFDQLERVGLKLDVLYYDGYSAHLDMPQDFTASHRVTRRENIAAQIDCFAETRRRGIMPGAELARFWAIGECDYFFFTDWSADRLSNAPNQHCPAPVGEPVPLFQLVFHDCAIAGFSGGGYATYAPGYDWWDQCTPRLYELMFGSAPAYNWLPQGDVPVGDWDSDLTRRKLAWLKRWNTYYKAIAMSAMASHEFLSSDHTMQRVTFENGISAEFDMAENRFRVTGQKESGGAWETPTDLRSQES